MENQRVSRKEDMSPTGKLEIFHQDDGDIIVQVFGRGMGLDMRVAAVEFCMPYGGGGRSPHTRRALVALMEAIELDNKESPI